PLPRSGGEGRKKSEPITQTGEHPMARSTTAEAGKYSNGQQPPRTLEEHLSWLDGLHAAGVDLKPVAENLFREKFALQGALDQLRQHQQQLRDEIEALLEPEHYPAVITGIQCNGSLAVEVHAAGMLLEVGVHPEVPQEQLRVG